MTGAGYLLLRLVEVFGSLAVILYGFTWFLYRARDRREGHTRWLVGLVLDMVRGVR
jgi:hypothetical protein